MRFKRSDLPGILIATLGGPLMMLLFLISGWGKLTGFSATVGYMGTVGAPMPMLAAIVAVLVLFPIVQMVDV